MMGSRSAPMVTPSRPTFLSCLQSVTADTCNNVPYADSQSRFIRFARGLSKSSGSCQSKPLRPSMNWLGLHPVRIRHVLSRKLTWRKNGRPSLSFTRCWTVCGSHRSTGSGNAVSISLSWGVS